MPKDGDFTGSPKLKNAGDIGLILVWGKRDPTCYKATKPICCKSLNYDSMKPIVK